MQDERGWDDANVPAEFDPQEPKESGAQFDAKRHDTCSYLRCDVGDTLIHNHPFCRHGHLRNTALARNCPYCR
jgi:hypothetical protein